MSLIHAQLILIAIILMHMGVIYLSLIHVRYIPNLNSRGDHIVNINFKSWGGYT